MSIEDRIKDVEAAIVRLERMLAHNQGALQVLRELREEMEQ